MSMSYSKIAKEAGVSVSTVQRVMTGGNKENWPSTVERAKRVRDIAEKFNFRPNSAARAMRRRRFDRIACVFFTDTEDIIRSPAITTYAGKAALTCAQNGLSMIYEPFTLEKDGCDKLTYPSIFTERTVDGILAIDAAGRIPEGLDQAIEGINCPTVWLNRNFTKGLNSVRINEFEGANKLARHVMKFTPGHVVYFGLDTDHYSTQERLRGVRKVCKALPDGRYVEYLMKRRTMEATDISERILAESPRPVWVICYNRFIMDVLIYRAAVKGVKIGSEIHLFHFASDVEKSREEYKFMTTWELPELELAKVGVEKLIKLVRNRDAVFPDEEMVSGRLHLNKNNEIEGGINEDDNKVSTDVTNLCASTASNHRDACKEKAIYTH